MTLELRSVTIGFAAAERPLVRDLNLTVPPGTVTTIAGASGVGKSTLLSFIGGHLPRDAVGMGEVLLNGNALSHVPAEGRRIGILFQDAMLFPHLSVADNLAFGLSASLRGRMARRVAIAAALAQAGLAGLEDRDPATLSGGQRARAALMRTLLAEPLAVLLDEPFSRLDPVLRDDVRSFVFSHLRARNIPALLVTHDADDATAAGGPVLHLG